MYYPPTIFVDMDFGSFRLSYFSPFIRKQMGMEEPKYFWQI